jgi:hypothetical protein
VVAFSHRARCAYNGPDCETTAEGYERFFAEAAPYLVDGVFVVEVAVLQLVVVDVVFPLGKS